MEKLPQVETARALMTDAMKWSVLKWLREKKKVRKTADIANEVLDRLSVARRAFWRRDVREAYDRLESETQSAGSKHTCSGRSPTDNNSEAWIIARKIKEAEGEAYRARIIAEQTFEDAEKQLSTALAREGCMKAIRAWELLEKAIRKAEDLNSD